MRNIHLVDDILARKFGLQEHFLAHNDFRELRKEGTIGIFLRLIGSRFHALYIGFCNFNGGFRCRFCLFFFLLGHSFFEQFILKTLVFQCFSILQQAVNGVDCRSILARDDAVITHDAEHDEAQQHEDYTTHDEGNA